MRKLSLPNVPSLRQDYFDLFNNPMRLQKRLLRYILKKNKDTEYGLKYGFSSMNSLSDYSSSVPIVFYSDIKHLIDRLHNGENNILTKSPVVFFGTTSGSTGIPKLIPITLERKKFFRKEFSLWLFSKLNKIPLMLNEKMIYFVGGEPRKIHLGSKLHGAIGKYLISVSPKNYKSRLVIPLSTLNIRDQETKIHEFAKKSLLHSDITRIGCAFPLEALQFFDYVINNFDLLLKELDLEGNKKAIKKLKKLKNPTPKDIWPNISIINCIDCVGSELYYDRLFDLFGKPLIIEDPGIYSTETRLTINLKNKKRDMLLAANVTFFEFEELTITGFKPPVFLDDLNLNKTYRVIVTTVDGLYRYNMKDLLKVVGFDNKLPIVRYVGRDKHFSVSGEKSSYFKLEQVVSEFSRPLNAKMATLMPGNDSYELFIELPNGKSLSSLATKLDLLLKKKISSYSQARSINNLKRPNIYFLKEDSWKRVYYPLIEIGEDKPFTVTDLSSFRNLLKKEIKKKV